jgi:formate/nitrite transporter
MSNFIPPSEVYKCFIKTGEAKSGMSALKLIVSALLAGAYIGFAAHLATSIATGSVEWTGARQFLTGAVFSFGLMLVIIPGSELWTGNNLMLIPLLEKKIRFRGVMRNWFYVYFGNFAGALLLAVIIAWGSGLLDGAMGGTAIRIAVSKLLSTTGNFDHNISFFFRGVACNWLVCLAVVMAMTAEDIAGKILAIFFPIMAFVASGFEHCVANMYFLTAGIFAKDFQTAVELSGASPEQLALLNWTDIWTSNLISVTLGNLAGGTLFVAAAYWLLYVRNEN